MFPSKLPSVLEFDPKNPPLELAEKLEPLWGFKRLEECFSTLSEEIKSSNDIVNTTERCLKTEYIIRGKMTGGKWNQLPGTQEEGHEVLVIICSDKNFAGRIIDALDLVMSFGTQKEVIVLPQSWSQQSERRLQAMVSSFWREGVIALFIKFPLSAPMRGFTYKPEE